MSQKQKAQPPSEGSTLQKALITIERLQKRLEKSEIRYNEPIAVIGMGCRFPGGVNSPEAFWDLLHAGRDVIEEIPPDRWDVDEFYDPEPATHSHHDTCQVCVTQLAGQGDSHAARRTDPAVSGGTGPGERSGPRVAFRVSCVGDADTRQFDWLGSGRARVPEETKAFGAGRATGLRPCRMSTSKSLNPRKNLRVKRRISRRGR